MEASKIAVRIHELLLTQGQSLGHVGRHALDSAADLLVDLDRRLRALEEAVANMQKVEPPVHPEGEPQRLTDE